MFLRLVGIMTRFEVLCNEGVVQNVTDTLNVTLRAVVIRNLRTKELS